MRVASFVAVAALTVSIARAELVGPGKFRSVYHVDRWGQHRFGFLFVDPALHERLAPHLGRTIELDVTELDRDGIGGRRATKIGTIEPLPSDLALTVAWAEKGVGGATLQVTEGARVAVEVVVANTADHEVTLPIDWARTLLLEVGARTAIPPDALWAGAFGESHGLCTEHVLSMQRRRFDVGPENTVLDVLSSNLARRDRPARSETKQTIAAKDSLRFVVTLDRLPPNEYEIALVRTERTEAERGGQPTELERRSNTLRIDVLEPEAKAVDGLRIDLVRAAEQRARDDVALRATFTNTADRTLCFEMPLAGGRRDIAPWTVAYDGVGSLIAGSLYQDVTAEYESVRLAPGASFTVDTHVPRGARLVRIVWWCGRSDADAAKGEMALPTGWHTSGHASL